MNAGGGAIVGRLAVSIESLIESSDRRNISSIPVPTVVDDVSGVDRSSAVSRSRASRVAAVVAAVSTVFNTYRIRVSIII